MEKNCDARYVCQPADIATLIAAYREQGRELAEVARELETMDQVIEINNRLHAELTEAKRKADLWDKEGWQDLDVLRESLAAATVAASARIDEIAALTAERDEAREQIVAYRASDAYFQAQAVMTRENIFMALLNKAMERFDAIADGEESLRVMKFGYVADIAKEGYAEIEAALQPKAILALIDHPTETKP